MILSSELSAQQAAREALETSRQSAARISSSSGGNQAKVLWHYMELLVIEKWGKIENVELSTPRRARLHQLGRPRRWPQREPLTRLPS